MELLGQCAVFGCNRTAKYRRYTGDERLGEYPLCDLHDDQDHFAIERLTDGRTIAVDLTECRTNDPSEN